MHILHVEDDPDIRAIVAMSLNLDPAITVRLAASGAEALDLWSSGYRSDVVLIDVEMPEINGTELLNRLRGFDDHETVVFVFLTASVRVQQVSLLLHAGATAVIAKPFDPLDLAPAIRKLVSQGSSATSGTAD